MPLPIQRNGGLTDWDYAVFVVVAEAGNIFDAIDEIRKKYGQVITDRGVEYIVGKKIPKCTGHAVITKQRTAHGIQLTAEGEAFLSKARRRVAILETEAPSRLPVVAHLPHHRLFVADAIARVRSPEDGSPLLRAKKLGQEDRGTNMFHDRAVHPLMEGTYRIIVGPRPENSPGLRSTSLYRAQLEAMVPAMEFDDDYISLADLVQRHRLLVPPPQLRSRSLLEDSIRTFGIADPARETRIDEESFDTATSVLTVLVDHEATGEWDGRTVVVPSDVALVFKRGEHFGGRGSDVFKWVPVHHHGKLLRHGVYATTTAAQSTTVRQGVAALVEACKRMRGLEGEDFTP